jgi:anaerobic selenocysteine-containing dehydrogenase
MSAGGQQVHTFCPLCVSRCGAVATVEDGAFVELRPDPDHPTGSALCVKGKAAPEVVNSAERLLYPQRRTRPKDADDPGWVRISWDEALDETAARLREIAAEHGPEAVVFGSSSPSTSAMSDSVDWLVRLRRAFGSPNLVAAMELCGWGRYMASLYTYGAPVPGAYMPDLVNAGCILFWGYNPSVARLSHATATTAALRRGARLIVVDPRRAGLASKAEHWLRVRPGTDGALALSMTSVLIDNGWYDADFVRRWTNAPLLATDDGGRLLRADEVIAGGDPTHYVAWDEQVGAPATYDPKLGQYSVPEPRLALSATPTLATPAGSMRSRTVWHLLAERCRALAPDVAAEITGVPAEQTVAAARTLWESRPLAFYTWSGLEQHSNSTQTVRAIGQLYALTGCLDVQGGNVLFASVPTNSIDGADLISAEQRAKAIGLAGRPLGPAKFEFTTGADLYTAALDGLPYRARALVNFGSNLVMAHGDSARGAAALRSLDFFMHADPFPTPTSQFADIRLPVTSAWEAEALRVGFENDEAAQSLVQLRAPLVPPRGESRSDQRIIFDLAGRLGLGEHFFGGDIDAAWTHQLAPSGVTLDQLRANPAGVRVPLTTRYRKYAEAGGFRTPTRKIELYSETFARHGYPPLAEFAEPGTSPVSRPDLAERYPLILSCAKVLRFCETQHRMIPALRRGAPDPVVELHPHAALIRGIDPDDWVAIETPLGSVRARAKLNANLDERVVIGQHGWWQSCPELDLPGYPPLGPGSANLNLVLAQTPADPVGGSAPLRAAMCELRKL